MGKLSEPRDIRITLGEIQDVVIALDHYQKELLGDGMPHAAKVVDDLCLAFNNVLCRAYGIAEYPGIQILELQEERPE